MKVFKWLAFGLGALVIVVAGVSGIAIWQAQARLDKIWPVDAKEIPVPFPLSAAEIDELTTSDADLDTLARERAIARGRHYVHSRGACVDCHGDDLAGDIIVDNPVMGRWIAPNITRGGITRNYTNKDWVRIVRHGIKPDGTAATMPSLDFAGFSDQEISDMAVYIESLPASDKVMPPSTMGPMFAILILSGQLPISAEHIDHAAERPVYPPAMETSLALGGHLANVCKGCHGETLSGGRIPQGDPAWPPAANLTFHETGLAGWSLADFERVLREGVRPDGRKLDPAMPIAATARMEAVEIESLYEYLKTLPSKPMGSR